MIDNFFSWLLDLIDDPFGKRAEAHDKATNAWIEEMNAFYTKQTEESLKRFDREMRQREECFKLGLKPIPLSRDHFRQFWKPYPEWDHAPHTKLVFSLVCLSLVSVAFIGLITGVEYLISLIF